MSQNKVKSKPRRIDKYAEILISRLPPNQQQRGRQYNYVLASRLLHEQLEKYYALSGEPAPSPETIRWWFYQGCPSWAVAILSNILGKV